MSDDTYYDRYVATEEVTVVDRVDGRVAKSLIVSRGRGATPAKLYARDGRDTTVVPLTEDEALCVAWAMEEYVGLAERQRENGRVWRRRELTRWSLLLAFDLVVLGVLLAVTADRLLVGAAGTAAIAIALEVTRWLKR
jgi:hypothetical protein